jgi:hypothetical protein
MMHKPLVLFLFNSSDYAVRPWIEDGRFDVVSVDYQDTDHSGAHSEPVDDHTMLQLDLSLRYPAMRIIQALQALEGAALPSLVVSFAPCTDLAVSGARHFARKAEADPCFQDKAANMARIAALFGCPYAVENPVSVLATLWRRPDLYWTPADYGQYIPESEAEHPEFPNVIPPRDAYNKKSCLWTGNGFVLPEKRPVEVSERVNPGWAKLGGKSARTKYIRSLTPRGFAQAVYESNCEIVHTMSGTHSTDSC